MSRKTFVNLPVRDLTRTTEFFRSLGLPQNERLSDDQVSCIEINDDAYAMLHTEQAFREFTMQETRDTARSREVIVGLSTDDRAEVDQMLDRALAAGAKPVGDVYDDGYMYMRAFRDLDGHQWSLIYIASLD